MMGSSCSSQRRHRHATAHDASSSSSPRRRRRSRRVRNNGNGGNNANHNHGGEAFSPSPSSSSSSSSKRRGFKYRSYSSRIGRLCGGSEEDSSDEESTIKGPTKRSARHSVDAEVPDQSISTFYPPDDNYQPHPTDPTLRIPKTLTDLCIDAICRSLPNLEGELPPGLPQEIVDKIVSSLTSHSALNCTTLRVLKNCELGELSLAKCRGVSDDWFIPFMGGGGSGSGIDIGRGGGGRNDRYGRLSKSMTAPMDMQGGGRGGMDTTARPRSASYSAPPPLSTIHRPAQFILSSKHSSSFLEVRSSSSFMMDMEDEDEEDDIDDLHANGGHPYSRNVDAMEESVASASTSSFVSAKSTLLQSPPGGAAAAYHYCSDGRETDEDGRPTSPLLPSVLPPPEFFSLKLQGTPSSLWLRPTHHNTTANSCNSDEKVASIMGGGGAGGISPLSSSNKKPPPMLLPSSSSLQTENSFTRGLCNNDLSFSERSYHDPYNTTNNSNMFTPPSATPYNSISSNGGGGAISSSLTLLDLRGSHRLTDRGLLQLSRTPLCNLEVAKLDNCHGITGRGLIALSKSLRLHTLSMANCRRLTDEAVVNVSHLDSLENVNLGGCRCLTDRSLEGLSELVELRKLDLSQCDLITDEGLENLHNLELIDELSLGWCRQITDDGLSILAVQPNRSKKLRVLCLARCSITNKGLEYIGMLECLEQLDLNGCVRLSSAELGDTLEKLVDLSSLDVSYCPGILKTSWQGKINNLKSLELCYAGVRDAHITRFKSLPMLEELNLDSCIVGDWAIAHLADNDVVPNLTSLDLSDADISDHGLEKISKFQKLRRLSLFYCNVSNAGLRHLASITTLEVLNLDSREIDDNGLRYLRNLPLKSLDLFSNRVSDLGCAYISKIKTLTSLELCGGGVGDLGCAHLATLSNLTSLNLSQNEDITNRGAASLAALSDLKALNLSKTRVNSGALKYLSGLTKLQSLALYGCKDVEDSPRLESLQSELPSLRCIRLNSAADEDGVIDHVESDEEDYESFEEEDDYDGGDLEATYQRSLLQHDHLYQQQTVESGESSLLSEEMSALGEFEDAQNEEIESLDDVENMEEDFGIESVASA